MLDLIDIHIEVSRLDYEKYSNKFLSEPSNQIRERGETEHNTQLERLAKMRHIECGFICNAGIRLR
jgi:predicted ATPase with chaperone activity